MEIIPAIMPKNFEDLRNKVSLVKDIVPIVQVDIIDGQFVNNRTWPFHDNNLELDYSAEKILREEEGLPFWESVDYEFDLMVSHARENLELYTKLGARRIIFHLSTEKDILDLKEFIEALDPYLRENISFGLAIDLETKIEDIDPVINYIDFIQCMGIKNIGFQEQPFDERVLEQIKSLREKYNDLIISIDGGVSLKNAEELKEAGANRLVVGSALFKSLDIRETLNEFEQI